MLVMELSLSFNLSKLIFIPKVHKNSVKKMNAFNLEHTRLLMASNILEKEILSLVGLFLHLICQVLPLLLLSSIQIMQIKYFTESLSPYLTLIHVTLAS